MKTGKSIFISLIILSLTLCLTSCTDDKDEPKIIMGSYLLHTQTITTVGM